MIAFLTACLVAFGVAAAIPLRRFELPDPVLQTWWTLSLIGQCFALPLALLAATLLVLALVSGSGGPWSQALGAAALLLAGSNHLRNHRAGRLLLATVPNRAPVTAVSPFSGINPLRWRWRGVRRIADIAYGEAGRRNLLDLYLPEVPPATPMPIIVQVHGGAWTKGHKEHQGQTLLHYLASRGWMGVAINYRLGPEHRFPTIFGDVLRALAWVKRNAAQYGGNADCVAITGGSAGGHLASLCALLPDCARFKTGFEDIDTSVAAAIPIYARFDLVDRAGALGHARERLIRFFAENVMPGAPEQDPELWELASPVAQVHREAPPFFVIGSPHDCLLPCEEGRHFADALRRVSRNAVLYAELPTGQHGYDMLAQPLTEYQARAIERFLIGVLGDRAYADPAPAATP